MVSQPNPEQTFASGIKSVAAGENHTPAILSSCDYVLAGDVNDDCRVDSQDLHLVVEQWLKVNGIDLDYVGTIDLYDFAILAKNWLIDCYVEPNNPACEPKR